MDIVLPIVNASTHPRAAIDVLRKSRLSALITEGVGGFYLISAGEIAVGASRGVRSLLALTVDQKAVRRTPHRVVDREFLRGPSVELPEIEFLPRTFTLTKTEGTSAQLRFYDTDLATRYVSGPRDYYCDGPSHHDDFPPPDVAEGDDCPRGDGYKIVRLP